MTGWRLVADIGGTNVRFARADATGRLAAVVSYATASHPTFARALDAYLAETGGIAGCAGAALGAAGPVEGDSVTLTNHRDWTIDRAIVAASLAGVPAAIVNDLEAVAAALPHLSEGDVMPLGTKAEHRSHGLPMLALNLGTGLGAAVAARHGGIWWTHPSEAGHMTLAPTSAAELDLFGPVTTNEKLLSGPGIAALFARLTHAPTPVEASRIFAASGRDPDADMVIGIVTDVLGRIAGDLVLATGSWGGVFLCGSVALRWSEIADQARFRAAFENKGPMRDRLRRVPTNVIRRDNVALFGLARLAMPA